MKNLHYLAAATLLLTGGLTVSSCNNDDGDNDQPLIIWSIPLSTKLENPSPSGRSETGLLTMQLYSNNVLTYTFRVNNLTTGDALTMAHFHTGDPVSNGPVILPFPTFEGASGTGQLTLRQSLADSLKVTSNNIYFNVHSTQQPGGLVRGQVNTDIIMAADVDMEGKNEVPPVTTLAKGKALLRLTVGRRLFSKVTVTTPPVGDALTMAHIHRGAAGVNGAILVPLCSNAADFGISKVISVDELTANALRLDKLYTNVHSTAFPAGIIRGQIR